jgi:hypothetical protein
MTDSEMLELAALAAGADVTGMRGCDPIFGFPEGAEDGETKYVRWNPLTDDGDALRLAALLNIDLEWRADGRVAAYRHATANGYCFTAFESSRENREENTRRAIVRAAAEIGSEMIEEVK